MRVRLHYEDGVKKCFNYNKQPCLHNDNPEVCIKCYVWAGHGSALLYTNSNEKQYRRIYYDKLGRTTKK